MMPLRRAKENHLYRPNAESDEAIVTNRARIKRMLRIFKTDKQAAVRAVAESVTSPP